MGTSASAETKRQLQRSQSIDRQMQLDHDAERQILKILLLGAGDSGKSTLLKQIRILHAEGFSTEDLKSQRSFVHTNALESMASILKAMSRLEIPLRDPCLEQHVKRVINAMDGHDVDAVSAAVGESMKRLWRDGGVQQCFLRRNEYQLPDSAKYFLDALNRITNYDYVPNLEDVLRTRVHTLGIVEMSFQSHLTMFRIFDVGGQRSERRKWIHFFDNTTAVLFLASLSEYDQTLYEDGHTNRMHESFILFETVCNSEWFTQACMILFLNKNDIFLEKIKKSPLTIAFPHYTGPMTYEACLEHILHEYMKLKHNHDQKIFHHVTCATDTNQIEVIVNSTLDVIVEAALKSLGVQ